MGQIKIGLRTTHPDTPAVGYVYKYWIGSVEYYKTSDGIVHAIGSSDHGSLSGLELDHHVQYHNDVRGDIRYYTKTQVDNSFSYKLDKSDPVLSSQNILRVKKNNGVGEFLTLEDAVATITDSSATNPYLISVGVGPFLVSQIVLPPYVSVRGDSIQSTQLISANNNEHMFVLNTGCELSFMSLYGLGGADYAAIHVNNVGDFAQLHKISIYDFDIGILHESSSADSYLYLEYTDINGDCSRAVKMISNGFINRTNLENFYTFESANTSSIAIEGTGTALEVQIFSAKLFCANTQKGIVISNGASLKVNSSSINGAEIGVEVLNTGIGSFIEFLGVSQDDNVQDYVISHPDTIGAISGTMDLAKSVVDPSATIYGLAFDPVNGGVILNGPLYYSEGNYGDMTDISSLIVNSPTMGAIAGGALSAGSGLSLNVSAGYGYLSNGVIPNHILKRIQWEAQAIVLPANTSSYIYFNNASVLVSSTTIPNSINFILLGRVTTDSTSIMYFESIGLDAHHYNNKLDKLFREALGPIYSFGSVVSENGTRQLNVTAGEYYYSEHEITLAGGTAITFDIFYRSTVAGIYTKIANQTTVPNGFYDDGSGTLAALPALNFTKHLLVAVGNPIEKYILIYGQNINSTQNGAEADGLPLAPSFVADSFVRIASIVVGSSVSNIASIIDERPRIGFASSSVTGSITSHTSLSDLGSDDHTQYIRVDGARPFVGNQSLGGNSLTQVGTINSIQIETHASRHLPNGADPLATILPSSIGATNSIGIANAFSRGDHGHAHGNQGNGSQHTVATTSLDGFMSVADKVKLDSLQSGQFILSVSTYQTTSSIIFTVISDLQITLTAGKYYKFKYTLRYVSSTTGTGICVSVAGTASGSITAQATSATSASAIQSLRLNSFAQALQFTSSPSTAPESMIIEGSFVCTTGGTMYPQFRSETNGNQMQILSNSLLEFVEL